MTYPPFHPQAEQSLSTARWTGAEFRTLFPGESEYMEFKRGLGTKPIQEAVVAFSNSGGGVVLCGVTDDGQVHGCSHSSAEALHHIVADVRSPGQYGIHRAWVANTEIMLLSVSRRREGFAQTANGRVLVRQGPRNQPLFSDELARFVASRSLQLFERTTTKVSTADIFAPALEDIAEAYDWPLDNALDRLADMGLAERQENGSRLTVAGVLHLTEHPHELVSKALVEIFRYPSDQARDEDQRITIRGPLAAQVRNAHEHVVRELGVEVFFIGATRQERPKLPPIVLREAIANAVAHRQYEDSAAIRIELRPTSVTIRSPGGLPEPVTVENIRHAYAARNPDVIRTLRQLGLAEDAGRGIDVIQDTMAAELLEPPIFRDLGHAVEVVLPLGSTVSPEDRTVLQQIDQGRVSVNERRLLLQALRGERLTNAKARELLNIDSTEARTLLGRLRDLGLLTQHGERGGATYELSAEFAPVGQRPSRPEENYALLLRLAHEAPLTNERVRAALNLDRAAAQRLLSSLVKLGVLRREGERRGTKYYLAQPTLDPDLVGPR